MIIGKTRLNYMSVNREKPGFMQIRSKCLLVIYCKVQYVFSCSGIGIVTPISNYQLTFIAKMMPLNDGNMEMFLFIIFTEDNNVIFVDFQCMRKSFFKIQFKLQNKFVKFKSSSTVPRNTGSRYRRR